ncbi:MAG: nucleotide exchange factor GrpE [Marinilabiliaceae bacterium]
MTKKQATEEKEKKQNTKATQNQEPENKEKQESKETQEQVEEPENKKEEETAKEDNQQKSDETSEQCEDARQDAEDEKELLKRQLEELNDKHMRLIAEYDNFRKRTLREKMELSKNAGENLLVNLLPVLDDFERARDHIDAAKDLEAVKEGIELIYNKFQEYLKQQGVSEIETVDQEFDSELHEAVTKIPAPDEDKKGKIVDCVQKGYKLNDKVIRYPKVVVGE